MVKKIAKQKSTQTAASAQQDVIGLITTLIEKLVVLESKIDNVLSRVSRQLQEAPMQNNNKRPMHKAVCADCGKNCEVPFKPSADRPVYCKACFTIRKKEGTFMPRPLQTPKAAPVVKTAAPVVKKKKAVKKQAKKKG